MRRFGRAYTKLPREQRADGESEAEVVRKRSVWCDSRVSWREIFVVGAWGRGIEREIGLEGVGEPFASWLAIVKEVYGCLWVCDDCYLEGEVWRWERIDRETLSAAPHLLRSRDSSYHHPSIDLSFVIILTSADTGSIGLWKPESFSIPHSASRKTEQFHSTALPYSASNHINRLTRQLGRAPCAKHSLS